MLETIEVYPEEIERENNLLSFFYRDYLGEEHGLKELAESQDYRNADRIKPGFFENQEERIEFIQLWARLGIRHPDTYLDASLFGTYAYWWPGYDVSLVYHATIIEGVETDFAREEFRQRKLNSLFKATVRSLEKKGIDTSETVEQFSSQSVYLHSLLFVEPKFNTTSLDLFLKQLKDIPVVSLLFTPGTYTWFFAICLIYLFRKKGAGRNLWPSVMIIGLSMLSTINGYMRYMMPVVLLTPILIGICFINDVDIKDGQETENG